MQRFAGCTLFLSLLFADCAIADNLVIEVIPVSNRPLDELVAIVRPLVPAPGSVSVVDNQLVINSTPNKIAQIKRMLAKVDRPPKNLMVTVRYGVKGEIPEGEDADRRLHTRYSTERVRDSLRARVLEGHEVFVTTGESVPVASNSRALFGVGVIAAVPGVEYRDVSSGFYLRPRLNGRRVTIDVFAHRAQLSRWGGGRIDSQETATLISGFLGEWIDVGGAHSSNILEDDAITYSTRGERSLQNSIFVKVEALD